MSDDTKALADRLDHLEWKLRDRSRMVDDGAPVTANALRFWADECKDLTRALRASPVIDRDDEQTIDVAMLANAIDCAMTDPRAKEDSERGRWFRDALHTVWNTRFNKYRASSGEPEQGAAPRKHDCVCGHDALEHDMDPHAESWCGRCSCKEFRAALTGGDAGAEKVGDAEVASLLDASRLPDGERPRFPIWGTCEQHAPDMEPGGCKTQDCHIDPGVYDIVMALWNAGIKTGSSCQGGGPPHGNWERVVRFFKGDGADEAMMRRAYETAKTLGLPVWYYSHWFAEDGGLWWQLDFEPMHFSDNPYSWPREPKAEEAKPTISAPEPSPPPSVPTLEPASAPDEGAVFDNAARRLREAANAIAGAFVWDASAEGDAFWRQAHDSLEARARRIEETRTLAEPARPFRNLVGSMPGATRQTARSDAVCDECKHGAHEGRRCGAPVMSAYYDQPSNHNFCECGVSKGWPD